VVVIEEDRRQGSTHVPFDVVREHAEQDVSAYALLLAVMDWTDVELGGLQAAKGSLDVRQALVGTDHIGRGQILGRYRRTYDIDPVERGLGGDGGLVSLPTERVVLDGELEVLAYLEATQGFAYAYTDAVCAAEGPRGTLDGHTDAFELALGGL